MITATYLKDLPSHRGTAKLWQLSEPITIEDGGGNGSDADFVVTSAISIDGVAGLLPSSEETFIFPADKEGKVLSYLELPGSFVGARDHTRAIRQAGWGIIGPREVYNERPQFDLRPRIEPRMGVDFVMRGAPMEAQPVREFADLRTPPEGLNEVLEGLYGPKEEESYNQKVEEEDELSISLN